MANRPIEGGVQRLLTRVSIRGVLRAASVLLVLLAVLIAGALLSTNAFLRTSAVDLVSDQRAFDALQDMRNQLTQHHRSTLTAALAGATAPGAEERELERQLMRDFALVQQMLRDDRAQWHIEELRRALQVYLTVSENYYSSPPEELNPEVLRPELRQAIFAVNNLMSLLQVQAAVHQSQVNRWETLADAGGLALAISLIGLAALVVVWFGLAVKRPLDALQDAVNRFDSRSPLHVEAPAPPELERLARSLEELSARLVRQRSNQLTFLAAVAHDLRNPLASLRMSAARLTRRAADNPAQVQQTAAVVQRQVARMDRMIGDLLDATRIEAGQLELRKERRDLRWLVKEALATFEEVESRLELRLSDTPAEACVDTVRFEQVLHNLVSNAVKYSPMGGPIRVRVLTEPTSVRIEVQDFGVGIAPELTEAVFEPFRRTGSLKHLVPGVGLGLSVCRRIVEAHGGQIWVESRLGVGSTFVVRLPRAAALQPRLPASGSGPATY